jgi:hypothetical protein
MASIIPDVLGVWLFTQDGQQVVPRRHRRQPGHRQRPLHLQADQPALRRRHRHRQRGPLGAAHGHHPHRLDDTVSVSDAMACCSRSRRTRPAGAAGLRLVLRRGAAAQHLDHPGPARQRGDPAGASVVQRQPGRRLRPGALMDRLGLNHDDLRTYQRALGLHPRAPHPRPHPRPRHEPAPVADPDGGRRAGHHRHHRRRLPDPHPVVPRPQPSRSPSSPTPPAPALWRNRLIRVIYSVRSPTSGTGSTARCSPAPCGTSTGRARWSTSPRTAWSGSRSGRRGTQEGVPGQEQAAHRRAEGHHVPLRRRQLPRDPRPGLQAPPRLPRHRRCAPPGSGPSTSRTR